MKRVRIGLLVLLMAASAGAGAEPWTVLADPDPQPLATFLPEALSESRADGYFASGVLQNQADGSTSPAVGRFDANGNPL
ncbi:MAG: hypothetical protein CO182_07995, partial [Lysobacterales bacterium CG_4_9_14_3_um_filter_62_6]